MWNNPIYIDPMQVIQYCVLSAIAGVVSMVLVLNWRECVADRRKKSAGGGKTIQEDNIGGA